MISQEIIDAVLDRADIVRVVSKYVPELTRRGADYVCCCPFHQEKTPSFHVSPARQTWHCFGGCQEGGNVISFLMKHQALTFPQAVKQLAGEFGVDFYEEQEADAAREERLHKEALWQLNARVAEYYAHNLYDPQNGDALQYAISRFGEDYVRENGMGFAKRSGEDLYSWARQQGESLDLLLEVNLIGQNLERGNYYDFYRNRLIFPIRDRQRHVIGFTARDLSGSSESKYLNSKESRAYHKKQSVYGIDEAVREAARKEQFFIVEGAPDAMKMHSVGIYNAVAPLGGALTVEQLRVLKKTANAVCFINDADPPKEGEQFGAGIGYVIKNGTLALKNGFAVSVRELPLADGNQKQDPGSFFSDKSNLNLLPEEEFISWYASKIWDAKDNVNQTTEKVRRIAELASYIEDDVKMDILLDALVKLRKGKNFWLNLIRQRKWNREREENVASREVDLRKYGFYEENGCYYGLSDKGETFWCNFTLRPLFHVRDSERPRRLFEIKNSNGCRETIEFSSEELNSVARFRQKLGNIGNFVWKGNDNDLMTLISYLYDNTETAYMVKQMGWNKAGFYAFGNGIFIDSKFVPADEHGVVRTKEATDDENKPHYTYWYIPAATHTNDGDDTRFERQRKFVHRSLQNVRFGDYMKSFVEVYGDNGKVALCFWLASLFRDIVTAHTRYFPLLNLFGPKGSGKSELGQALMAFFVTDNRPPNIRNATAVALNDDAGYVCDALVHFDEYKNDLHPNKLEFLKGTFDGVGRTKMGGSSFEDRKMTPVRTGIVFSGQEMPTADIALFHRCIFLSFPRSEFTKEERKRYAALRTIQEKGLTPLTLQVLELRKRVQGAFPGMFQEVCDEITRRLDGAAVETRIMESWAKIQAVFRCIRERLAFPFDYDDLFEVCFRMMMRQNTLSGSRNEIAHFWKSLMFLRDNGNINEDGDYRIKAYATFTSDTVRERSWTEPHKVLLLNVSRVFQLYKEAARRSGDNIIPDDALREYLKNSDQYLGQLRSVRFKVFKNGYAETKQNDMGTMSPTSAPYRALAFDYESLAERYGISLESSTQPLDAAEEDGERTAKLPF